MKKVTAAIAITLAVLISLPLYMYYLRTHPPDSLQDLDSDLTRSAIGYEVVDGKPFVILNLGGYQFLDILELDIPIKQWPPGPKWEWTGDWITIGTPDTHVSADLADFEGETFLFGVAKDDRIVGANVMRNGSVVKAFTIENNCYILDGRDVSYGDIVEFVGANGNVILTIELQPRIE